MQPLACFDGEIMSKVLRSTEVIFAARLQMLKNFLHILSGFCLCLLTIATTAQLDPPEVECVFVDEDDNVVINWEPPLDPNAEFYTYHIWVADPINLIWDETILNNYATSSFVDTDSQPDVLSFCYYMTTEDINGLMSAPSDTLCTVFLDAAPSVSPPGYASLYWSNPYLFSDPPAGAFYQLLLEYPAGVWNPVAVMPYGSDEYLYEISVCDEFLNFQVVLMSPDGCELASNIDGDWFTDSTPPAIPIVTSVSIDLTTSEAVISWLPSESADTQAYIVYECEGAIVTVVDTVYGINNTQFTDLFANGFANPESYLVAAFDTCYSGTPPSPNTSPTGDVCNTSIHLQADNYTVCDDQITLHWTPYEGWPLGVLQYVIMHSDDNIIFTPLDTVAGEVTDYIHTGFNSSPSHYYYIIAHANAFPYAANSNWYQVPTYSPTPPDYIYTATATVLAKDEINITAYITPTASEFNYHLERKEEEDDNWEEVIVLSFAGASVIQFVDTDNLSTDVFSYTYRIVAENACGDFVDTANIGKTILLQGVANASRLVNTLVWSPYEDWQNGVGLCRVYRSMDGGLSQQLLAELPGNVEFYEDDVGDMLFTEGEFCYTIEAVENNNVFGPSSSSWSNELCVTQVPKIWIPNAFVVGGVNNVFQPVISFADFEDYRMVVYTRWAGDMIFETQDINTGWDGRYKGDPVPEGPYVYYVGVRDGEGRLYENTGFVMMLVAGGN